MTLLICDNPIVTTYTRYNVHIDYDRYVIYDWLKQHTKHVGISHGLSENLKMIHRVYAKLKPDVELAFIIKFGATRYNKEAVITALKRANKIAWEAEDLDDEL